MLVSVLPCAEMPSFVPLLIAMSDRAARPSVPSKVILPVAKASVASVHAPQKQQRYW
jgi:hypothetical protein